MQLENGDSLKGERIIYLIDQDRFLADSVSNKKVFTRVLINNGNKKNLIKLDNKPLNLTKFKGYSHKF